MCEMLFRLKELTLWPFESMCAAYPLHVPVSNYRYSLPAAVFRGNPIKATSSSMGASVGRNLSAGSTCTSVEVVPLFFNKVGKHNTLIFFPFLNIYGNLS